MMMSSRYSIVKLQPFNTSLVSFWKYAGACAKPKGTLLNWYLLKDDSINAEFGFAESDRPIW